MICLKAFIRKVKNINTKLDLTYLSQTNSEADFLYFFIEIMLVSARSERILSSFCPNTMSNFNSTTGLRQPEGLFEPQNVTL